MLPSFVSDVPLHCINEAAVEYHVPAKLIVTVLNVEQGKRGQIVKNKNGSYDIGPTQINSVWLSELSHFGISKYAIQYDPCANVKVGTWILSKAISSDSNLLKGIGNFHSHTPQHNDQYSQIVRTHFTQLDRNLKE